MSEQTWVEFQSEELDCPLGNDCPVSPTHTRMEWHSLGMNCGRCGQHTGNNSQGHYWGLCKVLQQKLGPGRPWKDYVREMHFCCPGDCELEDD